ncbi:hypothetical protein BBJ28_00007100 [Nothophytophthora sp. Chile5]|nr:hypothetical protein BBJ28_00007100 [Nothophytophthora sp. Chile5]
MFGGGTSSHSFGTKAPLSASPRALSVRSLEAVLAEKDRAQFLVGTSSLHQPNQVPRRLLTRLQLYAPLRSLSFAAQIHLIEVDDATNDVATRQVFRHPGEVLSLAPSPSDSRLLVACGKQRDQAAEASLWRLPDAADEAQDPQEDGDGGDASSVRPQELTPLAVFPAQKLPVSECVSPSVDLLWIATDLKTSCVLYGRVVWGAQGDATTLASAHETLLRTWRLDAGGSVEAQDKLELDVSMLGGATQRGARALAWDPHHEAQLAFALGGSVRTWDLRAKGEAAGVEDAHPSAALALAFNPNKPFALASGGDDGKLKFWDLRYARKPVLALAAHSHWVWSVRYHPQHDQLLLSGGSDATLALWRVSSISSAPLVELDERDLMDETAAGGAAVADTLIRRVDEHEDAVYAASWAAGGDAWLFASVSYDGRLAVNHVPSTEKYKILL